MSRSLVHELLAWCTPLQIETGFLNETRKGYRGDDVARIILAGKYGYRRGMKKIRAAPDTSHNLTPRGGDACPTPEQLREAVEAYPQDLDFLEDLPEL